MATRRRRPQGLNLTSAQAAALRRAEQNLNTRRYRGLVAALEQAERLAGELAGPHPSACPCAVCCSANPSVASAAVAASGELCHELIETLADTTGSGGRTVRRRKAA